MRNLTLIFIFVVTSVAGQSVKVMTYNIRYDNAGDGVNKWDSRKSKVFSLLMKIGKMKLNKSSKIFPRSNNFRDASRKVLRFWLKPWKRFMS